MKELIDKAAVAAEIEKYISNYKGILNKVDKSSDDWLDSTLMLESKIGVLQHILSFLDTIAAKEVNLDRAIDKWIDDAAITHEDCSITDVISTAKHFFELGLKAKGE